MKSDLAGTDRRAAKPDRLLSLPKKALRSQSMDAPSRALFSRRILAGLLLATLASACGCGPFRETELQRAIEAHDVAGVRRALDSGAALASSWLNLVPPGRLAILHTSSFAPDSIEVLRLVVAAAPDRAVLLHEAFAVGCPNSPCYRAAPVEYLARQRSVEAVQVLLDAGLDRKSQGVTNALVYAIAEDDGAMARLLIAAGAKLDLPATEGGNRYGAVTPLEAARRKANAALVEALRAKSTS